MLEREFEVLSAMPVSDYEEQIWLQQQQRPEQFRWDLCTWQLDAGVNIFALTQALKGIIEQVFNLNVRYQFSDDGDLGKVQIAGAVPCLETCQLHADELVNRLLAQQDAGWDGARQPPFYSLVIHTEKEIILALLRHPVLEQAYQQSDLLAALKSRYAELSGQAVPLVLSEIQIQAASAQPAFSYEQIVSIIVDEFCTALADPDVTPEDDFFDLGGHSLLATRIIGQLMNSHGIEISFNDFFKSPSAAALASCAVVKTSEPQQSPSLTTQPEVQAPLTQTQAFLWRAYADHDFSVVFNLPFALDFHDPVDEKVFQQAFTDLLVRHTGLRTLFHTEGAEVYQQVIPVAQLVDYSWFWNSAQSTDVTLAAEAAYRFDLSKELPLRIRFLTDPDSGRQTLSFLVHHMVIDEWSLNSLMPELAQAYLARANGQPPVWNTPAPSVHDFALAQQTQGINPEHLQYWTAMLGEATRGLQLPELGSDAGLSEPDNSTAKAKCLELKTPPDTYNRLSAFARAHESSLFGVMYTAIALALHKQGELKDIVMGTSASGRTDPKYFDAVGYFTTMVAHRVQFDTQQTVGALIRDVTQTITGSMSYASIPIDAIQTALGMQAEDGLLFDVYIQIHANNALHGALTTPDGKQLRYQQIPPQKNETMFGLHFEIMENVIDEQHILNLVITYCPQRYSTQQIESLSGRINQLFALFSCAEAGRQVIGEVLE